MFPDFRGGSVVKNLPAMQETQVRSLDWEDSLEKEIATHSSILAWETPRTEKSGEPHLMGLQNSWTQFRDQTTTTKIERY